MIKRVMSPYARTMDFEEYKEQAKAVTEYGKSADLDSGTNAITPTPNQHPLTNTAIPQPQKERIRQRL